MHYLNVSYRHRPIFVLSCLFSLTNVVCIPPVSEGAGVYVLYLFYFYVWVGTFHGCQFELS